MLAKLREYYIRQGIAAESFNCPHEVACRASSTDFVTAREAFVGSEYEKGTLPRLLFVSIDASSDHPGRSPSMRTLEHMRYWEETSPHGCVAERLPKNQHWYHTHKFAHLILERAAALRGISPFLFRDVHRYFAHTNSAKCKDAARNTGQGPATVFDNCRRFIAPEVELLRPDVLVTQGDWGHRSISGRFVVDRTLAWPARLEHSVEILQISQRPVLRFRLFHPRAFGLFHRQRREVYDWYSDIAAAFFEGGTEAAGAAAEADRHKRRDGSST